MAFQRNECSDWVKTYYGSLGRERRGQEAVVTGTMGPDRSRSNAENKGEPAFGNGSEGSLDGHCSLLLGDDISTKQELMQLYKTTHDTNTHTYTHIDPDQSPINVAPGFLLAVHGRWDLVGRLCRVTVNAPLLAKIIYARD